MDAIFGGRSARDASASSKAHTQVLTEFMQEMDGLSSAISNNDHRIVVVGATNRPFDLDDAILRRLPRRLLIDLPDERDREGVSFLRRVVKGFSDNFSYSPYPSGRRKTAPRHQPSRTRQSHRWLFRIRSQAWVVDIPARMHAYGQICASARLLQH